MLGAERVDHGVRCLEDRELVNRLVSEQVPLTVCPLSNVRLRVVEQLEYHPLRTMLDRGLNVTVNSDDPAYFGGYADDNLRECQVALKLSAEHMRQLVSNAIRSSFASQDRKEALLTVLGSWTP